MPPKAVDEHAVGSYPALAHAGGGYVWDEVLEYRVWCHSEDGADDSFLAFATFEEAEQASERTAGADAPLALVLQREYLKEDEPGVYEHAMGPRITEWPVEFLRRPRRTDRTIPDFLAPDAPSNRLDILRGVAKKP